MYKTNVPVKFKTEKDSKYTITECCVRREKKSDKTLHCDCKNIFYADSETAKTIRKDVSQKPPVGIRVRINQKSKYATFKYTMNGQQKSFRVNIVAEIGKVPLDLILDVDGRPAKNHRVHRGHKIVSIKERGHSNKT